MKTNQLQLNQPRRRMSCRNIVSLLILCFVLSFECSVVYAQQNSAQGQTNTTRRITGKVLDSRTKEPMVGATAVIKGTNNAAVTDAKGVFSLNVTSKSQIEVSYLGYKQQLVMVGDLGELVIMMESEDAQLGEIVVVGAGTQRKISVSGAITSIAGGELRAPSSSLTSNLTGKLAGVVSVTKSGEPGTVSDFYIRGISTFGGRATPLILMDDIEISSGDLNNIPTESIASFTILKDASATAIYGARGANGVMIIKTKDGQENTKTRVNVTLEGAIGQPMNTIDFVDGPTFMSMYNEAASSRTPGASDKYSAETIEYTRSKINPYVFPDTDWYNLLFKDHALSQRANINIQGGGSRVTYYMGLQANLDDGILNSPKKYSFDTNIKRREFVFQSNISYKLTPTTTIDMRINDQIGYSKGPSYSTSELFDLTYNTNPVAFPASFPGEEGDDHIRFGGAMLSGNAMYPNPYAFMINNFKGTNHNTINTSLKISQDFNFLLKGLTASVLTNWKNYSNSSYTQKISPYYYRVKEYSWDESEPDVYKLDPLSVGDPYISQSGISRNQDNTFYLDGRINYNYSHGKNSLSAMLMYMMREYRSDVLPSRNQGLSGRLTYDYDYKYLAELNFGYNGTERLEKGRRFEFFPAVSLGWVASREKFFQPLSNVISFLKIRGSYGLVGSDESGKYDGAAHFLYKNSINLGALGYHTGADGSVYNAGPAISYYAVQNAYWERVKKFNIGFDITLFNQLNLVFDYFKDKRDRILLKRGSFPEMLGYGAAIPWSNIGKVNNQGVELAVSWNRQLTKDFRIDTRLNITYNENKYVFVDEPNYPYIWQSKTGKPMSHTMGFIAEGLFKDEHDIATSPAQTSLGSTVMPGDIKYRDINGDGAITEKDQCMISKYGDMPRLQFGFGLDLSYKKFDFGMFFNGSAMRTIMVSDVMPFIAGATYGDRNVMKFIADDYWKVSDPNPDAKFPRLGVTDSQVKNNKQASTYWMHDGKFLRLKTLEVGYRFAIGRVYVNCDNVAVWSPFKLWDPELSWNSYPLPRTFNLGCQLNF